MRRLLWRLAALAGLIFTLGVFVTLGAGRLLPTGVIAFESTRNLNSNSEIYIADINRRIVINVTNHPAPDHNPTWSPDGRQLAFETNGSQRDPRALALGGGGKTVYIVDLDNRNRTWRALPRNIQATEPQWSPDGTDLVVSAWTDSMSNNDLFVFNIYDQSFQQVTDTPMTYEFTPSWSPDGAQLLYGVRGGPPPPQPSNPLSGIAPRRTDGPGTDSTLQLTGSAHSPAGQNGNTQGIFVMPYSELGMRAVQNIPTAQSAYPVADRNDAIHPSWLPDGRVMFMYNQVVSSTNSLMRRLYVTLPEPGAPDVALNAVQLYMEEPAVSPDGAWVAFTSAPDTNFPWRAVYVMRTDGTDIRRVTFGHERYPFRDLSVAWRPPVR